MKTKQPRRKKKRTAVSPDCALRIAAAQQEQEDKENTRRFEATVKSMLKDVTEVFGVPAEAYTTVDDGNCALDAISHALNQEEDVQTLTPATCRRMCFENVTPNTELEKVRYFGTWR